MQITFRHIEPTDSLKIHTTEKVEHLSRLLREPMEAKVVLSVEKNEHIATVSLTSGRNSFEASHSSEDMRKSINIAVHKIEHQISKTHSEAQAKKKRLKNK